MTVWDALVQGRLGGGAGALFRLCAETFRTGWHFFVPLIFASLVAGGLAAAPPLIIAFLIDQAVDGGSIAILSLAGGAILAGFAAVALADAGLAWLRNRYAIAAQIELRSRIVPRLFASGLRQAVASLQENSRAAMIRSFDDLDETIAFLTATLPEFFGSALLAASYAALLVWVNPLLAVISLTAMLMAFLTTLLLARRSHRAFAAWLVQRDRAFTLIVEAFVALLTIKTLNAHQAVTSRLLGKLDAEHEGLASMRQATALTETASRAWMGLMPGMVVLGGLWQIGRGSLTVGELVLFLSVTASLAAPVASLCLQWEAAQRSLAAIRRISQLRASELELLDAGDDADWSPGPELELREVTHHYAGAARPALQEIASRLPMGAHIAVTGRSGGGKTTFAHILARLVEPTSGEVLDAGFPVRRIGLSSYRRRVLLLPHETHVFSTSVAMNIALWDTGYSSEEIRAAASAAGLAEVIDNLPARYETPLAADGEPLSAGQIQRIGIARALLRRPEILILDEATSSLDAETEARVMEGIRSIMQGRTLIVITHREELAASFPQRIHIADGHVTQIHPPGIRKRGLALQPPALD